MRSGFWAVVGLAAAGAWGLGLGPIWAVAFGVGFGLLCRFIGAVALSWRPLRGTEARPHFFWGGVGFCGLAAGLGVLVWARDDTLMTILVGCGACGLGLLVLVDWYGRRVVAEGRMVRLYGAFWWGWRADVDRVDLSGGAVALTGPGKARKVSLALEGGDGVAAALVRAGAAGPDWTALLAARTRVR